jgi:hypothetical protein
MSWNVIKDNGISSRYILPLVGVDSFVIKLRRVDLPTPDGPTKATTYPDWIV